VRVDVRLHRGVPAAVENLAPHNLGDRRRGLLLQVLRLSPMGETQRETSRVSGGSGARNRET
jgi:hypothetical protein